MVSHFCSVGSLVDAACVVGAVVAVVVVGGGDCGEVVGVLALRPLD